jgi:hypothetical protein
MKRILGVAVFVLLLSAPAHGQARGSSPAPAVSSSTAATSGGGGGGIGGGALSGASNTPSFHHYPAAKFDLKDVSGTEADFTPSAFLPYDRAIAAGQAALNAQKKTLVEAAAEGSRTPPSRAKVALVQDANGDPIIVSRSR